MAIDRSKADGSLIEVLDRILDKGIVIDAYVNVSVAGVDLVSVEARIVVASVHTYLQYADAISLTAGASRPQPGKRAAALSAPAWRGPERRRFERVPSTA
jgi:hypothetical protein